MFIQIIFLVFLLFEIPSTSASRYGAFCYTDSDCDQYQRCLENLCRCDRDQRRFWTGKICAICAQGFTSTYDRCYKLFSDRKTWIDARAFCRSRYTDLFTWRDNADEQFIRPVVAESLSQMMVLSYIQTAESASINKALAIVWSGATIKSFNPYTIKWVDPNGMQLDATSQVWCDPTSHTGYELAKQPTMETRRNESRIEREECVTYIFGGKGSSLLCLADEFCSAKLPFICEMNTASMDLTNSEQDNTNGNAINFEEPSSSSSPPPAAALSSTISGQVNSFSKNDGIDFQSTNLPSALAEDSNGSSMSKIVVFLGIMIFLIVGAIAGYMFIKKRKQTPQESAISIEETSTQSSGPNSTISLEGLAQDAETQNIESFH